MFVVLDDPVADQEKFGGGGGILFVECRVASVLWRDEFGE